MTSKLRCPFCKEEIISDVCCMFNKKNKDYITGTQIYKCNKCGLFGNKELVQELIRTRKALEIARKALEKIESTEWYDSMSSYEIMTFTAMKALEQIEHKDKQ